MVALEGRAISIARRTCKNPCRSLGLIPLFSAAALQLLTNEAKFPSSLVNFFTVPFSNFTFAASSSPRTPFLADGDVP